jgi:hypothetical protein
MYPKSRSWKRGKVRARASVARSRPTWRNSFEKMATNEAHTAQSMFTRCLLASAIGRQPSARAKARERAFHRSRPFVFGLRAEA